MGPVETRKAARGYKVGACVGDHSRTRCIPYAVTPLTKHISFCSVQGGLKHLVNMREPAPVLPSTLALLSGFEVRKHTTDAPPYNPVEKILTPKSSRWPPTELSFAHSPYSPGG